MTGYGRGTSEKDGRSFNVEMKSVNNRYLDITIKLPRHINVLEDTVRKYISQKISRGKVDIYINQECYSKDDISIRLDEQMAQAYYDAFQKIKDRFGVIDDVSVALIAKSPDVITVEKNEEDYNIIWQVLKPAVDQALDMLIDMRSKEGVKLTKDIDERCALILGMVEDVESRSPQLVEEYREKISDRIKEYLKDVELDETRLLNEVAFFADKASITEEIVRMKSHVVQLKSTLSGNEPVGRKLDFIAQEMNRETNTIGSKANDLYITNVVVNMKSELEKIREQIQNLE
jgi:uncharacterized protein (TIGR00255 family)